MYINTIQILVLKKRKTNESMNIALIVHVTPVSAKTKSRKWRQKRWSCGRHSENNRRENRINREYEWQSSRERDTVKRVVSVYFKYSTTRGQGRPTTYLDSVYESSHDFRGIPLKSTWFSSWLESHKSSFSKKAPKTKRESKRKIMSKLYKSNQ